MSDRIRDAFGGLIEGMEDPPTWDEVSTEPVRPVAVRRRRPAWAAAAAAGVVLVFGAVAVLLTGTEDPEPGDVLSLLAESQTAAEGRLPPMPSEDGVPSDSLRLVYEDDTAIHWVGVSRSGDICFATRLAGVVGSGCVPPSLFAQHGNTLTVSGPQDESDVTFVPDGFASEGARRRIEEAGGSMPVDNLVIFPSGERPESLVVEGSNGVVIQFGRPGVP